MHTRSKKKNYTANTQSVGLRFLDFSPIESNASLKDVFTLNDREVVLVMPQPRVGIEPVLSTKSKRTEYTERWYWGLNKEHACTKCKFNIHTWELRNAQCSTAFDLTRNMNVLMV